MKTSTNPSARVISLALAAVLFTGCSARFDAAAFVEDTLDARYRGVCSPELPDLTLNTEEEITALYKAVLESEAEYFCAFFDINKTRIPVSLHDDIVKMLARILSSADFTPGEAVKTENGFSVSVAVRPLDIMQKVISEDISAFTDEWQTLADLKELEGMSVDEFETRWARGVIELVSVRIPKIGQLEAETVSVRVTKETYEGKTRYTADEKDIGKIIRLIILY